MNHSSGATLVTGARGFVGKALVQHLRKSNIWVRSAIRLSTTLAQDEFAVGDIGPDTGWEAALDGCRSVVHLAARVHVMNDKATNPLAEFRRTNVDGTLHLARQSAAAGVRRFVYLSSIKVNGESTRPGQPFTAADAPAPQDAYGISKNEAEQGLLHIAAQTGLEVVIIRPPLVYGPGVGANFAAMLFWLKLGVPLPLGAIHNQRSLVAVDNLVDLIATCLIHPAAANQTFLVSDGHDVSSTELLCRMALALGKPAHLLPVPQRVLRLAGVLVGKSDTAQRLCDSLQVDISKTRSVLGWTPVVSLDEGLRRVAEDIKT